ncbi:hypothetical protein FSP39_011690 [Pinctada imbricata]|uniref:Glycoside hydrolase family 38 central domain-containing protein n=1 Tax=Pinctada imbricata TaxID=66713 RepID=A0AA88YAF4_PINIB|nr:hypothetical protein FSP39_011690 [Pinctada imbricata]
MVICAGHGKSWNLNLVMKKGEYLKQDAAAVIAASSPHEDGLPTGFMWRWLYPLRCRGPDIEVHFLWNSHSEAMIWQDGQPLQGLSGEKDRISLPLSKAVSVEKNRYQFYVEMACNGLFGAGNNGLINPPDVNKMFTLSQAELAVFDRLVYNLQVDIKLLHDMAKLLPEDIERGYQALYTVNSMINLIDFEDRSTMQSAHQKAESFFKEGNGASQHTLYAMGHAHIDTAWLWPYAETIRKCARSWVTTIRLMEDNPNFIFTCSQAQQYEWLKSHYPGLYKQIQHFVKKGQFIPVGGSWVEMDGNIPSGEAFVRQFLYGQRFFQKEFQIKCKEHHTFWWEGIDGSRVLSHFPPGDCYTMKCEVKEMLFSMKNYQDKGRSPRSVYLFGHGDGGQGPTEDMLEVLKRVGNVDGLPRVKMSTPDDYFSEVEHSDKENLCTWRGELYLELHNGTYTTHAKVKQRNRLCEFLLHDVEFLSSVAAILSNHAFKYPQQQLHKLWKLLLLNQFHDVLPGSSIGIVYDDAHTYYKEIMKSCKSLTQEALKGLTGSPGAVRQTPSVINTIGWTRREVIQLPESSERSPAKKKTKTDIDQLTQIDSFGNTLAIVDAPSYGFTTDLYTEEVVTPATVTRHQDRDGHFILQNGVLRAFVDNLGRITELYIDGQGRKPLEYALQQAMILDEGPLRASLQLSIKISDKSYLKQIISLDAGSPYLKFDTEVHWHESHKFLKAEFATSIHSNNATYEIQYGHLQRTNHNNTSWDWAQFEGTNPSWGGWGGVGGDRGGNGVKYEIQYGHLQRTNQNNTLWDWAQFEVCGHKWADISEYGSGAAILNDSHYGYYIKDGVMRLSLLRSPKAPDEQADMGVHKFKYAFMPHQARLHFSAKELLQYPQRQHRIDIANDQSYVNAYI